MFTVQLDFETCPLIPYSSPIFHPPECQTATHIFMPVFLLKIDHPCPVSWKSILTSGTKSVPVCSIPQYACPAKLARPRSLWCPLVSATADWYAISLWVAGSKTKSPQWIILVQRRSLLLLLPVATWRKTSHKSYGHWQGCEAGTGTGRNRIHLETLEPEPEPYSEYGSGSE